MSKNKITTEELLTLKAEQIIEITKTYSLQDLKDVKDAVENKLSDINMQIENAKIDFVEYNHRADPEWYKKVNYKKGIFKKILLHLKILIREKGDTDPIKKRIKLKDEIIAQLKKRVGDNVYFECIEEAKRILGENE